MLRVLWAHLCNSAMFNASAARVVMPFQGVTSRAGQPLALPKSSLAFSVEADSDDDLLPGAVDVELRRWGGQPVRPLGQVQLIFKHIASEAPKFARAIFPTDGLQLPEPGDYALSILDSGREIGRVPFRAVQEPAPPGAVRPPLRQPEESGLELIWIHLLGGFEVNEFRAQIFTDIVDYFLIPPREKQGGLRLDGCAIVFHVEADTQFAGVHDIAVEIEPQGRELQGLGQQNTFRQIAPDRSMCTSYVRLDGAGLFPGKNWIRLSVDGRPVGNMMFHVIPASGS